MSIALYIRILEATPRVAVGSGIAIRRGDLRGERASISGGVERATREGVQGHVVEGVFVLHKGQTPVILSALRTRGETWK